MQVNFALSVGKKTKPSGTSGNAPMQNENSNTGSYRLIFKPYILRTTSTHIYSSYSGKDCKPFAQTHPLTNTMMPIQRNSNHSLEHNKT